LDTERVAIVSAGGGEEGVDDPPQPDRTTMQRKQAATGRCSADLRERLENDGSNLIDVIVNMHNVVRCMRAPLVQNDSISAESVEPPRRGEGWTELSGASVSRTWLLSSPKLFPYAAEIVLAGVGSVTECPIKPSRDRASA
jgi:hypothetical protein